jgi:hypothetical protein
MDDFFKNLHLVNFLQKTATRTKTKIENHTIYNSTIVTSFEGTTTLFETSTEISTKTEVSPFPWVSCLVFLLVIPRLSRGQVYKDFELMDINLVY